MHARPLALALAVIAVFSSPVRAQSSQAVAVRDCIAANDKVLGEVDAVYTAARLPKPDQEQFNQWRTTATAPIKPKGPGGGSGLGTCQERARRLVAFRQSVQRLITPQLGDHVRGGVVFQVASTGTPGLVSEPADVPVAGGVMHFEAAQQACNQSTTAGLTDWYLPNSTELNALYGQQRLVGGFKTSGRDQYWNSSRMFQQDHKVYWQRFSDGFTGWADTERDGPTRALFNARCIRKY